MNSRTRCLTLIFALSICVCLAAVARAQVGANRSSITGFVFDQNRRPVVQIPIELLNEVNSVVQRTRTDNSGRFSFIGLSQGRFTIKVMPLGTDLEEQRQDVEIAGVGARGRPIADHIQQDVYLRPRKDRSGTGGIVGTVYAQEVPETARQKYKDAVAQLDDNKVEAGIVGLQEAIKSFPDYYHALERLGLVYISQQKFEDARTTLERASAIYDRSFNVWYGIGYSDLALKQFGPAIKAAEKAVEIKPDSVDALLVLGISLRSDKQYKNAEQALRKAKNAANGESAEVHWQLALLYAHNLNRPGDAADELELYLKANPDVPNKDMVKKLIKQFRDKAIAKS